MRIPFAARIGVALILMGVALYVGWTRWVASRTWVPLDIPVSIIHHTYLRSFDAEKGIYDLDVEVRSDASCLNPLHPRLRVDTSKSEYADYTGPLLWLSALCVGVGMSLLVLFSATQLRERSTRAASFALSESVGQYFHCAQKFPIEKRFPGLPSFGLVAAITYLLVVVPLWLMQDFRLTPVGLKVRVLKPAVLLMKVKPLTEPVVVRLVSAGPSSPPKLYLNSRVVPLSGLDSALKMELKLRPDWVVYFEGDPNLNYGDGAAVIDIIRGAQAEVVLLTPGSQKTPAP